MSESFLKDTRKRAYGCFCEIPSCLASQANPCFSQTVSHAVSKKRDPSQSEWSAGFERTSASWIASGFEKAASPGSPGAPRFQQTGYS